MGGFISKQPNGLYCRFSTVVDCPTDWNMTVEDYIYLCKRKAEEGAREVLEAYLQPFEMVVKSFSPNNMSQEEFNKFLEDVNRDITFETNEKRIIKKELNPCPFCSGEAVLIAVNFDDGDVYYRPQCSECQCGWQENYKTENEAINAWNIRKT